MFRCWLEYTHLTLAYFLSKYDLGNSVQRSKEMSEIQNMSQIVFKKKEK